MNARYVIALRRRGNKYEHDCGGFFATEGRARQAANSFKASKEHSLAIILSCDEIGRKPIKEPAEKSVPKPKKSHAAGRKH